MSAIFLVLIVLFAILASYYLYKNDFNKETLGVVFPAVGAIALTLYLGVKTIWIDAPAEMVNRTNIVLLQDINEGILHSLSVPPLLETSELYFKFRGLKKIMEYRVYNDFKDLPDWEKLKSSTPQESDEFFADFLEFAFLDWLSQPHATVGHINKGTIVSIQGASQSYGVHENLVPLVPVSVRQENEQNPFLKSRDVTIKLPNGSKIIREKLEGPFFRFVIETPNSEIEFRVFNKSGGSFSSSIEATAKKIRTIFRIPDNAPGLQVWGMPVEIVAKLKPFARFSDQAKIESEWHRNVVESFESDFSWDRLREYYVSL